MSSSILGLIFLDSLVPEEQKCYGLQLQQGVHNRGSKIQAKHIIEVLDEMSG